LEVGKEIEFDDKTAHDLISARRAIALGSVIETRDPTIAIGDRADTIIQERAPRAKSKAPGSI